MGDLEYILRKKIVKTMIIVLLVAFGMILFKKVKFRFSLPLGWDCVLITLGTLCVGFRYVQV